MLSSQPPHHAQGCQGAVTLNPHVSIQMNQLQHSVDQKGYICVLKSLQLWIHLRVVGLVLEFDCLLQLANILRTADGGVKLADFGLATLLEAEDAERHTICGTPNYISPEIAANRPYSLATDVWSLGVVLATMLTGIPPFQGTNAYLQLSCFERRALDLFPRLSTHFNINILAMHRFTIAILAVHHKHKSQYMQLKVQSAGKVTDTAHCR